jgi:hypothetical protein
LTLAEGGFSCARIGRAEGLSRERIRQIVVKGLDENAGGSRQLNAARLLPALLLAAGGIAEKRLEAIGKLVEVIGRLETLDFMGGKIAGTRGAEAGESFSCAARS